MPCPCCQPPDIDGIESFFDSARAQTEADAYLRGGLDARSARLIDYLLRNAGGALRLLDIGGGVGGVHYELLRRGVAHSAVAVEASSAYIDAARAIGRELGLDDRVNYLHADFARSADSIDAADAVILDRVICCYPLLDDLLSASADKAGRFLALSYPRAKWWVFLTFKLFNLFLRLKRSSFRTYLHPHSDVHAIAAQKGLEPVHADTQGLWQITVFARAFSPSPHAPLFPFP